MDKPDTRRTDWIKCKDGPWYPELSHGGIAAYRIWKQFDGLRWFQRHEWRNADGSIDLDAWIPSVRGWPSESVSVPTSDLRGAA